MPTATGAVQVTNSGTWVVTGTSSITGDATSGAFRNSGTIWALDTTGFDSNVVNAGGLINLVSTGSLPGTTTITGDYSASGAARVSFYWPTGGSPSPIPGFVVEGNASGRTEVVIANPQQVETLDWSAPQHITLVTVKGDAPDGADQFYMDYRRGLLAYGLDYADAGDRTWSLTRGVNVDSAAALSNTAYATRNLLNLSTGLMSERIDELRDTFFSGASPSSAMAYAPSNAASSNAASSAFASIDQQQNSLAGRAWLKAAGVTSTGNGYGMDAGVFQGGIDIARQFGDDFASAGLIAGYGQSKLDFDAAATNATIQGPVFGAYGTYVTKGGLFMNGILLGQVFDVDMALASVPVSFGGSSIGGRVESGVRLQQGRFLIEPAIGVQASHASFDTVNVAAIAAGFDDTTGLSTDARLRLVGQIQNESYLLKPYGTVMVGYEFLAKDNVVVSALDTTYVGNHKGVFGNLSAGLMASDLTNTYGGFVQGSFEYTENRTGLGLKLGGQMRF